MGNLQNQVCLYNIPCTAGALQSSQPLTNLKGRVRWGSIEAEIWLMLADMILEYVGFLTLCLFPDTLWSWWERS